MNLQVGDYVYANCGRGRDVPYRTRIIRILDKNTIVCGNDARHQERRAISEIYGFCDADDSYFATVEFARSRPIN